MAGKINLVDKYYCEFCKQHFRIVYNLYRHKCPNQKFIDTDKPVTTKPNNN